MKRILTSMMVIIFTAVMLAGCVSVKVDFRSPAPIPSPKELTRGTIEGNVYTNELAELTFTAPEGWKYSTDEEFEKIMGFGVYDGPYIHDMFVYAAATGISVMVSYEDLSAGEILSEETYIDLIKKDLKATYSNPEFNDHAKTTIGSNTYSVMTMDCSDLGMTQYYYVRRTDGYMLYIMVTTYLDSDADPIMANFS